MAKASSVFLYRCNSMFDLYLSANLTALFITRVMDKKNKKNFTCLLAGKSDVFKLSSRCCNLDDKILCYVITHGEDKEQESKEEKRQKDVKKEKL